MNSRRLAYNLIVASEDKPRTIIETLICALLVLSAAVSIAVAAVQPVAICDQLAAKDGAIVCRA
jgi:hypothetical protein